MIFISTTTIKHKDLDELKKSTSDLIFTLLQNPYTKEIIISDLKVEDGMFKYEIKVINK